MRILAIAESFFGDHRNGLARVAWDVARAMAFRGHDVHLVCPASSVTIAETHRVDGVLVTRYPRPRVSAFDPRNPWTHIRGYAAAIQRVSSGHHWDVVHCHGIYGMNAASQVFGDDLPKVLTVHSPAVLEQAWSWTHSGVADWAKLLGLPLIRHFERRAIAASSVCHSLSLYTRDTVRRLYPEAYDKPWQIVPHWIDASWYREVSLEQARHRLGWPAELRIVLTVRQLKPRYGIDVAIRALAPLLKRGGAVFHVVGDGPERQRLQALAADVGVVDKVVFEGSISDEQLRWAYQAADAFVIPSRALECFGLIALEAMAVGLPTVATMVGALPEVLGPIFPDGLVPPGDEKSLRDGVARSLATAGTPSASRAAATLVSDAKNRYAKEDIVPMYERLFSKTACPN